METLIAHVGKGIIAVILMGSAALAIAASDAPAQISDTEHNTSEPLVLRGIMQELNMDMQRITDGIATENWSWVAEVALSVANHPQPPVQERLRIVKFIGTDIGHFKSYDQRVHEAAEALSEAAQREDGTTVIEMFAKIQSNCLGCHQSFRQPIQTYFYSK